MLDNQGRSNFDKVIVVDINPGNDELTKEFIMGKFARVLRSVSAYQNIVIMSHSNLHLLLKLISDINIKNGYVVSDYGARIYSLRENKIIYENAMNPNDINALTHYGIMLSAFVLGSAESREFAYSIDQSNAIVLQKRHYLPLLYTNDYSKFNKFLKSANIFSVMLFQKDREKIVNNFEELSYVIKDWNINVTLSQGSYFVATDMASSKYQALMRIIENLKITNFDHVNYYAINSIDEQCLKAFKNHLIHQEIAFNSKYINEINIQASLDEISDRMYRLTFVNSPTFHTSKKNHMEDVIDGECYTEIMQTVQATKKQFTK